MREEVAPRIVLVTGRMGSGKTWHLAALTRDLLPKRRAIVLDASVEWPYGPLRSHPYALAGGARGARELAGGNHSLIVVRPPLAATDRPTADAASALAEVAWGMAGEVVLVLPEAHLAAREGWPLPPGLVHVAHRSRHVKVILLCDTQHPARLSTAIRDEARWYVHATTSARDIRRIAEAVDASVGREHVDEALAAVRSLDSMPPGYHIVIDGVRSDFRPRR